MLQQFLFAQVDTLPNGSSIDVVVNNGDIWSFVLPIIGVFLVIAVILTIAMWKIFMKAGRPGWIALVPIYNMWTLFEVAGRPGWWSLVSLAGAVPLLGFIAAPVYFVLAIIAYIDLAKSFGKGAGFGVLLVFLPFIGFPILGFGSAQYAGPAGPEKGTGGQASNGLGQTPPQSTQVPNQPGMPPSPYAQSVQAQEQPVQPPQPSQPQQQPAASAQSPENVQSPQQSTQAVIQPQQAPQSPTQQVIQPQSPPQQPSDGQGQQPPAQPPTA